MEKILGIDYGTKRLGIAISDALGMCAHPRDFIVNNKQCIENILSLASNESVSSLLIGLPHRLNGDVSFMEEDIQKFITVLKTRTDLPIHTWDERLSTAQAEKLLISADVKRKKRKETRDSMAASILLQSYLESKRKPSAIDDFEF